MHIEFVGRSKSTALSAGVGVAVFLVGLLSVSFMPSPARAALTISCTPTYADPPFVTVGETLFANLTFTISNQSDGAENTQPVTINSIRHTPACGNSGSGNDAVQSCAEDQRDAGVFTVANTATGIAPPGPRGASLLFDACVGRTFTVTASLPVDAGNPTEELLFTPDLPIQLAQNGLAGSGCIIQFMVQVDALPTHDAGPGAGAMTNQLCRINATAQANQLTLTNGGLGQVSVITPTETPTVTATNTATETATNTPTSTPTSTPTATATATSTPTATPTSTDTPEPPTPTFTPPPIPVVSSPTSPAGLLLIIGLGLAIGWMVRRSATVRPN